MKYPKILPCEIVVFPNSAAMGQLALWTPSNTDQVRLPVSFDGTGAGASNNRTEGLVPASREFLIVSQAVSNTSQRLRKVDMATGIATPATSVPNGQPRSLTWFPDQSKFFLSTAEEPYLEIWDPLTLVKDTNQLATGSLPAPAYQVAWHPNGAKFVVSTNATPFARVFNYPALTPDADLPGLTARGEAVAWSSDGNWIAVGGVSSASGWGTTRLYDAATLAATAYSGTRHTVSYQDGDLSFSPDSKYLLGLTNGTVATTLCLIRLSDMQRIPFSLPAGYQGSFGSSANGFIHWLTDEKALLIYNTTSQGFIAAVFDVEELTFEVLATSPFVASVPGRPVVPPGFSYRRIAGVVTDPNDAPLARTIRVVHRESGISLGEVESDPNSGAFEVVLFTSEAVTVFAVGEGAEVTKLKDSIVPVPI